jgi:hypothetical protein
MSFTEYMLFSIVIGIIITNGFLLAIVAELKKQSPRHHRVHYSTSWRGSNRLGSSDIYGKA